MSSPVLRPMVYKWSIFSDIDDIKANKEGFKTKANLNRAEHSRRPPGTSCSICSSSQFYSLRVVNT